MIDPTQAAGQPAPAPQQGAPEVCIKPQGDGSFMVYTEGQEDQGQPAQDIDSALELVRQMLESLPPPDSRTPEDKQADDLFQAGFDGANPRAMQG